MLSLALHVDDSVYRAGRVFHVPVVAVCIWWAVSLLVLRNSPERRVCSVNRVQNQREEISLGFSLVGGGVDSGAFVDRETRKELGILMLSLTKSQTVWSESGSSGILLKSWSLLGHVSVSVLRLAEEVVLSLLESFRVLLESNLFRGECVFSCHGSLFNRFYKISANYLYLPFLSNFSNFARYTPRGWQ